MFDVEPAPLETEELQFLPIEVRVAGIEPWVCGALVVDVIIIAVDAVEQVKELESGELAQLQMGQKH